MDEDAFVTHRSLLFTVAYEVLGSAADAEDVVQETWLRWDGLGEDARAAVLNPRAYLVRAVTRQALNRLRTLSRHPSRPSRRGPRCATSCRCRSAGSSGRSGGV